VGDSMKVARIAILWSNMFMTSVRRLRLPATRHIGFALVFGAALLACSSSSDDSKVTGGGVGASGPGITGTPPGPPATFAPDEKKFEVAWKPAAKVLTDASTRLIDQSEDAGTFTYRFRPDSDAIAALAPDDIAVLGGIAYRRVVSVEKQADAVVLVTKRTKLTDAIDSGTMAWKQKLDFGMPQTLSKASFGLDDRHLRPLDITTGLSYSGMVGGFDVSTTLRPMNGRLEINVTASKSIDGERRIALTGEGYLESFQSDGQLVFDPSGLVDFRYGSNQVRGEIRIKAAAFNAGVSQDLLNVPLRIQIPLEIGPVPVLVSLGANINVTAALNAMPNTAEAEVTIGFNTTQGIQVTGSSLNPTGSVDGQRLDVQGGGGTSSIAAGLTICVEAPRVEMAFLGETASVGLTQNNCAATVYTSEPACNEVNASIVGRGLAQLGFFGVTLAQADVELYSRHNRRTVGDCGPPQMDH
jgi:hypothetical protein